MIRIDDGRPAGDVPPFDFGRGFGLGMTYICAQHGAFGGTLARRTIRG
jgi:hypothetical protein